LLVTATEGASDMVPLLVSMIYVRALIFGN